MANHLATDILKAIKAIANPKIVITTHHKPDADAMGSSLGLQLFLKNYGLPSTVITPTDFASFLHWMKGSNEVIIFEENEGIANQMAAEADFIFCLDFNHLSRINDFGPAVGESKAIKILIDHHQFPQGFQQLTYWDDKASSTCELVYRLISESHNQQFVDKEAAACLYTGIMTDTGSFKHSNCSSQTHRIAADLIEYGIDHVSIHELVFDSFTEDRVRFIGYALSQKLEVLHEFKTALITINNEELKKYRIQTGDTEGLVNYGLGIEGIKFAILIIDRTKLVKMSFRSKGSFAANAFAMNHFNGGGHFNAAGGSSTLSLQDTIAQVKEHLKLYQNELNA
jgi:phosphoesterase RecJ-like protein